MSLATDLAKSSKLSFGLAKELSTTKEKSNDKKFLSVLFNSKAGLKIEKGQLLDADGKAVKGVKVASVILDQIFTASVSINGLQNLVSDKRITSVENNRKIRPAKNK